MQTIVKSIRLKPEELAWAVEACDRLGIDHGTTPNGAIKVMFYAGLNALLGNEWTIQDPPQDKLEQASVTKQPLSPDKIPTDKLSEPESGRFAGINPPLADEHQKHIWEILKNEHLTPTDQLSEPGEIANITAQLLRTYVWQRLTSEEQKQVEEVLKNVE